MTQKAYKTAVGAFVILGIAAFTLGLVLLGGGKFLTRNLQYTLYFDGSVSGLAIGAPVVFRGVPMGSVTQISLVANDRDSTITIPVTISIAESSFINPDGQTLDLTQQAQIIHAMIERGMRARLQLGSLITGQYRIELDFFPRTPMTFRSSNPDSEIPTIPSPIDTLQRTLANMPIEKIADSLLTVLDSITDAVGEGQLKEAIQSFSDAFHSVQSLLDDKIVHEAIDHAAQSIDRAAGAVERGLPETLESFQEAMNSFTRAANQLRKVGESADGIIGRDSATMNDLRRLLREATLAAGALRNFADMLERNPEALLRGRQGSR